MYNLLSSKYTQLFILTSFTSFINALPASKLTEEQHALTNSENKLKIWQVPTGQKCPAVNLVM
jgi:hypothetical protein